MYNLRVAIATRLAIATRGSDGQPQSAESKQSRRLSRNNLESHSMPMSGWLGKVCNTSTEHRPTLQFDAYKNAPTSTCSSLVHDTGKCHIPNRKSHKCRTCLEVNLAHNMQRHGKGIKVASL